ITKLAGKVTGPRDLRVLGEREAVRWLDQLGLCASSIEQPAEPAIANPQPPPLPTAPVRAAYSFAVDLMREAERLGLLPYFSMEFLERGQNHLLALYDELVRLETQAKKEAAHG